MLNARAAELAPELLKGGRADQRRRFFEAGSVDGEPGRSLKLNLSGPNQGRYTDFNGPEGTWRYSGDMLTLVEHLMFGGDKGKAVAWAKSRLGLDDLDPARIERVRHEAQKAAARSEKAALAEVARKRRAAAALWHGAAPLAGTPGEAYLRGRGIDFSALGRVPGALRYCPDVWCQIRRGKHPALIAAIMGLDGQLRGVHRTYLDLSAGKGGPVRVLTTVKAADGAVRIVPPGTDGAKSYKLSLGPYFGGCIPLWKGASRATLREIPAGTPVYVSEGIEDGLSVAMAMPSARVVAGVALANMGGLELPPQVGPLIVVGQNDAIGSKAVEALERVVQRQQQAGRRVQLIFPEPAFKDFNDQLLGRPMAEARA